MVLSDPFLDDGNIAVNKTWWWLQPKTMGVVAFLGVVCISGFVLMPEVALEPQARPLAAPLFLEQVAESSAVSVVKTYLHARGEGVFDGKDALEAAEKMMSSDFYIDASGPNNPGFKVYKGPAGMVEWVAFFSKTFTLTDAHGNVTAGHAPGQAFWQFSVDVLATPSREAFTLKGIEDYKVNSAGLISSIKIYWDTKVVNECLAAGGHIVSPIAVAKKMAAAWAAGAFSGEDAMETAQRFYTADAVIDASGPNEAGFKVYKGRQGVIDWLAFLGQRLHITDVRVNDFPGPAPDLVLWAYTMSMSTPKEKVFTCKGYNEFKVTQEGKISAFTVYWDVTCMNKYLAESEV